MKSLFVLFALVVLGLSQVDAQAAAFNPFSEQQLICIRNCPRVANYNPVCGTDNFQYENPGHLSCARQCNHNVQIASQGRCEPFLNPPRNQENRAPQGNQVPQGNQAPQGFQGFPGFQGFQGFPGF